MFAYDYSHRLGFLTTLIPIVILHGGASSKKLDFRKQLSTYCLSEVKGVPTLLKFPDFPPNISKFQREYFRQISNRAAGAL